MGWLADVLQELPPSAALRARLEKKEAEYEALKTERDNLIKENAMLKEQVASAEQGNALSNEETDILAVLAHKSEAVTAAAVANHFGMHLTKAEYFLNELEEKGLITVGRSEDDLATYGLSRDGKKLAVKLNFV